MEPLPAIGGLQDPQPLNAPLDNTLDVPFGESIEASAARTLTTNPTMALRDLYEYGADRISNLPKIDPQTATERYGHLGLSFDRPVTERYAEILADQKRRNMVRDAEIENGPQGFLPGTARFFTGLGLSMTDPINIASTLIPVVGEARIAATTGILSKTGLRAISGGIGGLTGAAAVEPLVYAGAQARQDDYGVADSLLNLTFGTIMGGGLHVAGGWVSDHFLTRKAASAIAPDKTVSSPIPSTNGEIAEQLPAATRDAVMRTAIGQAIDGKEVNVAPIIQQSGITPGNKLLGNIQRVYDSAGKGYDTQFDVVEAKDLTNAGGDLQPRDRTRIGSDDQINRLAQEMIPERLADSTDAATGAPIVGPDNVIESGNGRVAFIRKAYANNYASAGRYKNYLRQQGIDVSGYDQPILIRRRLGNLTDEERRAFVVNAQAVGTMALSASERAKADASIADRALEIAPLQSSNLRAQNNIKFVKAFLAQIPQSERAGLMTGNGELAQSGISRMRNGLLARAFDDTDLLNNILEETDDTLRNLGNTMYDVSVPWADMRNDIRVGTASPYVDATNDLLNAVRFIRRAKDGDVSLREAVTQGEMAELKGRDARTVETNQILSVLMREDEKGNYRLLPKEEMVNRLKRYTELARETVPTDDMFGAPPAKAADVLETLRREIISNAERDGIKPSLVDVPEGGIINLRELTRNPDTPRLDIAKVREEVLADMPADPNPDAPKIQEEHHTLGKKEIDYATKDNTAPEHQRIPTLQDVIKSDAIDGDSMASHTDLTHADAINNAKELPIDQEIGDIQQALAGLGELTDAEKASLDEADAFIKDQDTIRAAIAAAATCVAGG